MADGNALSWFQLQFEHSVLPPTRIITSDGNLTWMWLFPAGIFMLELPWCLAPTEMYWFHFYPRDIRGLLGFSERFVILTLQIKAAETIWCNLIPPRLPSINVTRFAPTSHQWQLFSRQGVLEPSASNCFVQKVVGGQASWENDMSPIHSSSWSRYLLKAVFELLTFS